MPFPSPPWNLQGTMWLSVFPVRSSGTPKRPAGLYGAAFVDYAEGGVLAYQELLVARLVRDGAVPRVPICDIWVDSAPSRDGGRALWAIPKELADLHRSDRSTGPSVSTSWEAGTRDSPIAAGRFTAVRPPVLRTPFAFSIAQQRDDIGPSGGTPAGGTISVAPRAATRQLVAKVSGTAKTLPCLGSWDFAADGPLGWLHGRKPVLSMRVTDFRLTVFPSTCQAMDAQ